MLGVLRNMFQPDDGLSEMSMEEDLYAFKFRKKEEPENLALKIAKISIRYKAKLGVMIFSGGDASPHLCRGCRISPHSYSLFFFISRRLPESQSAALVPLTSVPPSGIPGNIAAVATEIYPSGVAHKGSPCKTLVQDTRGVFYVITKTP